MNKTGGKESMSENKYYVTVNNQTVAEGLTCEYALILVKALIKHFYCNPDIVIAIAEMTRGE